MVLQHFLAEQTSPLLHFQATLTTRNSFSSPSALTLGPLIDLVTRAFDWVTRTAGAGLGGQAGSEDAARILAAWHTSRRFRQDQPLSGWRSSRKPIALQHLLAEQSSPQLPFQAAMALATHPFDGRPTLASETRHGLEAPASDDRHASPRRPSQT